MCNVYLYKKHRTTRRISSEILRRAALHVIFETHGTYFQVSKTAWVGERVLMPFFNI